MDRMDLAQLAIVVGLAGAVVYGLGFSDWAKRQDEEREVQDRADATPHVIRAADGCRVYAFKAAGEWHYFTRCGDGSVTTERNWTESHRVGKQTVTEHKSETIVTTGNK